MKQVSLSLSIFLSTSVMLVAQSAPNAFVADELTNELCSEAIKARIDGFIVKLNENPSAQVIIVGSADKHIPGRYSHYGPTMQKAFEFRHVPRAQLAFIQAKDGDKMNFQFWIVPRGAEPPVVDVFAGRQITDTTLWDKSWINTSSRTKVYFGGEDEPCDFGLNLEGLAKQLGQNSAQRGYVVAFSDGDFGKRRAMAAAILTRQQLQRRYQLPKRQLSVLYGGRVDERQVQLWVIPSGKKMSLTAARSAATVR